ACLQQEEEPDHSGHAEEEQAPLGVLQLLVLPKHLRTVLEREFERREALFDIVCHSLGIAPAHVEAHVDATRDGLLTYDVRARRDADRGSIPEAHGAAVRRVDEQITDTAQALARLGRTPHYHLEHLLILEEAAGFNACHQGGGGST